MKPITILACDPSFTAWGYAVLRNKDILEHGCIKTKTEGKKRRIRKSDETSQRISELVNRLKDVIEMHGVNYIVSEAPHGSQSAVAAVMMGAVVGLLQSMAICLDIPIEWYSEGDAKKAVLGKISASKEEMIKAINKRYDVEWTKVGYRNEAVADALAIHYVACQQSPTIKFLLDEKKVSGRAAIGLVTAGMLIKGALKKEAEKLIDQSCNKMIRRRK